MSTYLLSVGINDYTDRAFKALSCCENDATEIHALFKRNLELGERARKLVGRVTTVDVKSELRRIGQEVRNGDTFVFFFAGHGYQHPKREDQYLLFPEAEARLVNKGYPDGMLSLSALCELTDHWAGVARVFVLDACRSWLPGRNAQGEAFDNEAALAYIASRDPQTHAPTRSESGTSAHQQSGTQALPPLILNATKNGEVAQELERQGRGVLALALERTLEAQSKAGEVVWLGQQNLAGIGEEMRRLLQEDGSGASQTPFMVPSGGKAMLYKPRIVVKERAPEENAAVQSSLDAATEAALEVSSANPDLGASGTGHEMQTAEERWRAAVLASQNGDIKAALNLVKGLAEENYPTAINWLASWHYYGGNPDVLQDKAEGRRLFERAADLGDVNAMRNLALVLKEGTPSAEVVALSNTWMARAAQAGSAHACVDLCVAFAADDGSQVPSKAELEAMLEAAVAAISGDDPWQAISIARLTAFGPLVWRRMDLVRLALKPWQDATEALSSAACMVSQELGDPLHEIQVINAWLLETSQDATEADKSKAASIYASLHQTTQGVQPGKSLTLLAFSAEHGVNGFVRDPQQALALLERGAALGDAGMQYSLRDILERGHFLGSNEIVCPVDMPRAGLLLHQSAENGYAKAMVDMATEHSVGLWGIEKDLSLARQWLERALQKDLTSYQLYSLGQTCRKGKGALNDDQLEASVWQRCLKIANGKEYGMPEAMVSYALQLWEGRGVQQDRNEAERLLNRSVAASYSETAGYWEFAIAASFAKEVVHPGIHEHRGKVDWEAALVWLKKSAEAGFQNAMWTLVHSHVSFPSEIDYFHKSFSHLPDDTAESQRWLQKLSELGDVHANEVLALALLHGQPYERNVDAAERLLNQLEPLWSEKADFEKMLLVAGYWEALGDVSSGRQKAGYWRNLARRFGGAAAGKSLALKISQQAQDGLSEQATQAFRLMEEAARSGDFAAMLETGLWLLRGYGGPVNEIEADRWFARYTDTQTDEDKKSAAARLGHLATRLLKASPRELVRGLKWLEQAAESGDAHSVLSCGIAYAEGIGRERNLIRAGQHFARLFELDPESAASDLLRLKSEFCWHAILEYSRMSDYPRVAALQVVTQRGSAKQAGEAMHAIGHIYSAGRVIECVKYDYDREKPDDVEAFHWYKQSTESGYTPAFESLAKCFAEGRGTTQDQAAAQRWWLRAADVGSVDAMIALGVRAFKGTGQQPDIKQARDWFDKSAQHSDDAPSKIAKSVFDEEDTSTHRTSYEWLMSAFNRRPEEDHFPRIARYLARGWGVTKSHDEADRWLERYVSHRVGEGCDTASILLKVVQWWQGYENFPSCPERAVSWLRRAADLGNSEARCSLGEAYATGYGVEVNSARAEEWFQRDATGEESWYARMRLVYWWSRWGRSENASQAKKWLEEIKTKDSAALWELTYAAELAALRVFGTTGLTEREFFQKYKLSYAEHSYKYACELASLAMSISNSLAPNTIGRVSLWLSQAKRYLDKDRSNFYFIGDAEISYVESLIAKSNLIRPRHWLLRLFGS